MSYGISLPLPSRGAANARRLYVTRPQKGFPYHYEEKSTGCRFWVRNRPRSPEPNSTGIGGFGRRLDNSWCKACRRVFGILCTIDFHVFVITSG